MSKSLTRTSSEKSLTLGRVTFADHPGFRGTVGRAWVGGGLGALLAASMVALTGSTLQFSFLVTMLIAGSLAAVGKKTSWFHAGLGAALGLGGGVLYTMYAAQWPWFGALLLGAASTPILARGEPSEGAAPSPLKVAGTGLFAGMMTIAGLYVAGVLESTGVLTGMMPGAVATAVAGSVGGFFLGLGSAPRHIMPAVDPVEAAYSEALTRAKGELYDILDRALGIYQAVRDDLGGRNHGRTEAALGEKVSDMSMRILEITSKCADIERDLSAAPVTELGERIQDLEEKRDGASDPAAKATFQSAIDSLEQQRGAVDSIERGRERVVARLHANVALLEKVRFSLVHLRSADIERGSTEDGALNEALDELGRELDATSQAIGEVYGAKSLDSFSPALIEATSSAPTEESAPAEAKGEVEEPSSTAAEEAAKSGDSDGSAAAAAPVASPVASAPAATELAASAANEDAPAGDAEGKEDPSQEELKESSSS